MTEFERINEHSIEAEMKTIFDETGGEDFPPMNRHLAYGLVIQRLLTELKRCYEELDEAEYRLEMAEDVLGRSDWNSVYRELIGPPE